jgi:hypothetical protein
MVPIPSQVQDLIDRFEAQSELYTSQNYNETNLRIDFVNPMFKALGWDIDNTKGYAEAFREVVHEDAVRIAGTTKSPDYSFRIGGRRVFFLEAKKPAVNICTDLEASYQIRRYAWTAGLPLSILTNFKEFAVYDCRVPPKYLEKASTARLWYFAYKDYPQRWDEIASVFSPEAIQHGAFDRYVQSRKKSGTQEFDGAFLDEMEEWRKKLAGNLALRNNELDQPGLNFATQRVIDRIIFLRICEDRGIEPPFQLQALLSGDNTYARLRQLFTKADQRYNSGLFYFRREKDRHDPPDELTLGLDIDDTALKQIIKRLYYPDSPYVFKEVAADILGSVYERFLGNVIHLTAGHRAKIEPKPEVRKAKGVYYTPTYIVDYIVQHTVGKLLDGKTPADAKELRILDPACGSGSFLLGAYQYLLNWHQQWYLTHDPGKWSKGKNPILRPGPRGALVLSIRERKRILTDNIYGVDIDPQAVEVTELSLLLRCLEGESAQSINDLLLFHERALPDLGGNIKRGNSLISTDIYDTKTWKGLTEREQMSLRPFDWEHEFAAIMKSGGFNATIGNPPYISVLELSRSLPEGIKEYWKERYQSAAGAYDVYVLFVELAARLTRPGGMLGFIIPNKVLAAEYAIEFRRHVLETCRIVQVVDFSRVKVWPKASVYPIVPVLQKEPMGAATVQVYSAREPNCSSLQRIADVRGATLALVPDRLWSFMTRPGAEVLLKVLDDNIPLEDVGEVCGASTVAEGSQYPALLVDRGKLQHGPKLARFVVSGSVFRYSTTWLSEPVQFSHRSYTRPFIHLGPPMPDRRINQSRAPKIIVCKVALQPRAFLDDAGEYLGAYTTYILGRETSLAYLTGILNSRLMNFVFRTLYDALAIGGGYLRFQPPQIRRLPIRPIDFSNKKDKTAHERLVSLVDQMLSLNKSLVATQSPPNRESLQREIDSTDRRIDRLVYELYDLTAEEIKIVEEATGHSAGPVPTP